MKNYRALTEKEQEQLKQNGCFAESWNDVLVSDGFTTDSLYRVTFSGSVRIGALTKSYTLAGGVEVKASICNARIHNCVIGEEVYINNIHGYLANYHVGNGCCIMNVETLYVDGESNFGNGVQVSVLNEAGGREVMIYEGLTAQTAYMLTFYRHNQALIHLAQKSIEKLCELKSSAMGSIGQGSVIEQCGTLCNVNIGEHAVVKGVNRLKNGTICSSLLSPTTIGQGVIADDFIIDAGAQVTDGALLERCFVGQGSEIGKQFSAIDTLFFANCQAFHGEATSIFAAPYSVTHHKSTLLIGGYYSFFNAGSATNQSNHLYKLGPTLQGVVERGCKFSSGSYVMWPARIGAFSMVMGRHYNHPNSEEFPFSYLIEDGDSTLLIPGVNIRSIGTWRDAEKWQQRDRRAQTERKDVVQYNMLSPYVMQKVLRGREILEDFEVHENDLEGMVYYNHCQIPKAKVFSGIKFYSAILTKYFGDILLERLQSKPFATEDEVKRLLKPAQRESYSEWVDVAGCLIPEGEMATIIDRLEKQLNEFTQLDECFKRYSTRYKEMEWHWVYEAIQNELFLMYGKLELEHCIELLENANLMCTFLDDAIVADASKEFSQMAQVGYGIDGDESVRLDDFKAVRGSLDSNAFVTYYKAKALEKRNQRLEMIERLRKIVAE